MKTVVIAEAGVNHNGDINMALKLVEEAANAGADYVKFQTFVTDKAVSRDTPLAEYQRQTCPEHIKTLYDLVKHMELSREDHLLLMDHCQKHNISFLSSPFDLDSVRLLGELGLDTIKIPSGEIINLPYLRAIAGLKKKTILSTGMATLDEIDAAVDVLVKSGVSKRNIILLHCTTEYPCPMEDVNLKAIYTLKDKFGLAVGYSDHTAGIEVALAAVTMGAVVIEKHFTLDKSLPGPDHKASLDVPELKAMVTAIRNIETAMGNGVKKPTANEMKNLVPGRKSIFLAKNIRKGETFRDHHLIALRPGDGVSPMMWDKVIGNKAKKNFTAGHKLEYSDFE